MRELRLEDELRDIPLKQAQYIKRRVLAENFKTTKVGELVSKVDPDTEMPKDTHKGWWCFTDLVSDVASDAFSSWGPRSPLGRNSWPKAPVRTYAHA